MAFSRSFLKIDTKSVAKNIEERIKILVKDNSAQKVLIGISGGIDSAVLATLAVRALGKKHVMGYYLYDRDNEKASMQKAKLMADWLGIELKLHDIEPAMRKQRIYSPLIMRLMSVSGFMNRYLNGSLHHLFGLERPFVSALHKDNPKWNKLKRFVYNNTVRHIEAGFNARHTYRRKYLEQQAKEGNHIILGAANRSECMVGWFVKGGIDDMPFSPINGLYKTQVRQLAKYLDLPREIQEQRSSPDMTKGITDECAIGISYGKLDVILDGIDQGLANKQIMVRGVTRRQVLHVRKINKLSAWKRSA